MFAFVSVVSSAPPPSATATAGVPDSDSLAAAGASPSASSSSLSPSVPSPPVWGCVELGGTTIKVALAEGEPTNVVDQRSFDTGDQPGKALEQAVK